VSAPLTIVHVIARLNVGGASLHVLQLAREQLRRGHDVTVVAGTLAAGEESMEYVADNLGVDVHRLEALRRELAPRDDLTAIRALRRLIRERRPDVLHTHTAKAGAAGRLAAALAGRPRPRRVHTYHGHVLSGYFSPRRERLYRLIERVLARFTDVLVAVSDEVRDDLVRFRVAPSSRFAVVPYGFDLPPWGPADDEARARLRHELGLGDDTFAIGCAGRITAIKRPEDAVETLRHVRDAGVDAVLLFVGDGEDRAVTEARARTLGVDGHCSFVGFQQKVREWYAAMDALLLTSANEGTPVAAIEALAARRPVVATAVGGTPTVVDDGETGFLAAVGDTESLAARLVELARDPGVRAGFGARGEAAMRSRFATGRMADELEAIYRAGR
jgi:glycosyltransferase involved in cell wall biosynthesis